MYNASYIVTSKKALYFWLLKTKVGEDLSTRESLVKKEKFFKNATFVKPLSDHAVIPNFHSCLSINFPFLVYAKII